ncbi:ABC transporter ATP-binding protein [Actinomyces faecalis]|uniref:ABC transporter ATP-binding protein n=1 Tax=Actinomyces faecalis TaxID=2722820 RepID=UPI0015559FB1|nr:ATP-binding cassette domain-containing protein [Actinomyces faecalis]
MSEVLGQVPVISLEKVSARYGRRTVLSPVSLSLRRGDVLGLVGPNGAGKSTLMDIMACLRPPSAGHLGIQGTVVDNPRIAGQARRSIAYLPQHNTLIPHFTAQEMVEYAAWTAQVPRNQRAERVADALEAVDLSGSRQLRVSRMSGGTYQRLALATCLVKQPALLLLDEPTVGLDPVQRVRFRHLIEVLTSTAVVISSHLMEDIASLATHLLVLEQGTTRFVGPLDDLTGQTDTSGLESAYLNLVGTS